MGLPGAELCFEKKLIEANLVSHMRLFELNSEAYEKCFSILKADPPKSSYVFHQEDVDNYILSNPLVGYGLDVCWLDYCGVLNPDRIRVLNTLLENSNDNFILGLTFLVSRERGYVGKGIQSEATPISFLKRVHYLMKHLSVPVQIECLSYKDTMPMILLVLTKQERTSLLVNTYSKDA